MDKPASNMTEKVMLQSGVWFCTRSSHTERLSHLELQNIQLFRLHYPEHD